MDSYLWHQKHKQQKIDFIIKIKKFYSSKDRVKEGERQPKKKKSANNISNKGLVFEHVYIKNSTIKIKKPLKIQQ